MKEHDIVILKEETEESIHCGLTVGLSAGTIVSVHDEGAAYEVEFTRPRWCCLTLYADQVEAL